MSEMNNQQFYDEFAGFYDGMINFDESLERRKRLLQNFIGASKTAADIGCGTGLDSIALAMCGLAVTGFDPSPQMIETAKVNSATHKVAIEFIAKGIEDLPANLENKFDIVVSLGNALANIPEDNLKLGMKNINRILSPGGKIVLQILNYDLILSRRERIINITEDRANTFVRFYDFEKEAIRFNILKFRKVNKNDFSLISTTVFPYKYEELINILSGSGFKYLEAFGGLDKSKFEINKSKDVIITAMKGSTL